MNAPKYLAPLPDWEEHEKPTLPGSPATLRHPVPLRVAYACVALLIGITGGLGTALVQANLPVIQGQLGLTPMQGTWLTIAYVMVNVTANLLVFKFRQQYGIRLFAELGLGLYAALTLLHLAISGYEMAVLVRAVSGFAGAATSTLAVLYVLQAFPKEKLGAGMVVGIALSQFATPLAWLISPSLLELGDWRTLYALEAGLALCAFASVVVLKLPVGVRVQVLEPLDFLTFVLVAPGVALLAAVLAQGLNGWWLDTPWLAWALVGAVGLLTTAAIVEYRRETPLLQLRWLLNLSTLQFLFGAVMMRFLLSEQTYGAVGLLRMLGMGTGQLQPLYAVMLAGMVCGMAVGALTFGPKTMMLQLLGSIVLIAVGALLDRHSSSLSRPQDFFVSQFLIAAAATLFLGPVLLTGIMQALTRGADHVVIFIILFSSSQALGGVAGPALLGTLQAERTQAYVQQINSELTAPDARVAQRLRLQQQAYAAVITDPTQRAAQGAALLAQVVRREAGVRAYNDVFTLLAALAVAFLGWSLASVARAHWATRPPATAAPPVSPTSA